MSFPLRWRLPSLSRPSLSVLSLSLLLVGGAAFAAEGLQKEGPQKTAAPIAQAQQRPGHAGIASANFLATNAGLEVLAKGGNAFDAAIAVASTLSVVEPESSGIGGGFMAVLHRAKDDHDVFIDAREAAAAAVNPKDYLNPDGSPNRDAALKGPLSAGIPGEPAGLALIAKRYGRLSLKQSLAPAIRIASEGFQPDPRLRGAIAAEQKDLQRWPASAAKYLPNGAPPTDGALWHDPDQAHTLELLAAQGKAILYISHVLEVVEQICNRVIVIANGRILADAHPAELARLMSLPNLETAFAQLVRQQNTRTVAQQIIEVMQTTHG